MTGSTKILTVSYGTFSCTLEGFDDPFGTMRGIAEYFRDLAADDRYFGAEPPTPDVEMLQRIAEKEVQRRVEARVGEQGLALTQVSDADLADEDAATVESVARAAAAEVVPVKADPTPADAGQGPLTADDDFLLSDEPEDVLAVDPDARPTETGPAETVVEKLRRIREVVSRSNEEAAGKGTRPFSEPLAPVADPDAGPKNDRAMSETIRQITADLSDEDYADFNREDVAAPAFADDARHDMDQDVDQEVDLADDSFEPEVDTPAAVVADAEPTTAKTDDGWDFDVEGLAAARESVEEVSEDEDITSESVSRIISKLNGAEEQPSLSSAADAEIQGSDDAAERRPSKPLTPIKEVGEGEDVGRLLAETDNQLNDDESVRRRRVISQMRAAVAATKADRLVSRRVKTPEDEAAAEQERYRDDLIEAVRGETRPAPGKNSERATSVAPLVLVSAQRVDDGAHDSNGDNRLPTGEPANADAPDFAGFAKSMGAKELPDLLEAAAAYTSFVEGQPSFTRPEIMQRVARVDPAMELSREDGLRSFGQLLRQGKFRKLERGQFAISDTTRFKPANRIAGE